MSYFYFSGKNIITYNDRISIRHPFKTDFKVFVKAIEFFNIITRLNSPKIKLFQKEDKLNVASKTAKIKLAAIEDDEANLMIQNVSKSIKKSEWKKLPENFKESIKLCSNTASIHEADGTLTHIYLEGIDCISSDNNRISHAILDSEINGMFIKATEVNNLSNIDPKEYSVEDSWIHFKNEEGCIFSMRRITGEYPDYLQFFKFNGKKIKLSNSIIDGIDLTSVLADSSVPVIDVKIVKGSCIISIDSDSGKIQHKSKVDYKGKEINFIINPNFLKEMISHSTSIIVGEDKAKLETENKFSMLTLFFS
jgi:DNA polymerase III sliding clamp (beta) subunit (PCNA family)